MLPGVFLTAFGLGLAFVPLTLSIVRGVNEGEVGVASALFNTAQQIGAALGVAVFGSVASAAADDELPGAASALQHGLAADDRGLVARASQAFSDVLRLAAGRCPTPLTAGRRRPARGRSPRHAG